MERLMAPRTAAALSTLTEQAAYSRKYELVEARNATLILRDADGHLKTVTDLMSAYGAVNFGHLNPSIPAFTNLKADLAACFYPRSAYEFAEWIIDSLKLPDHRVLYQVGGSFAVSTALAMAQRMRPGRIAVIDGSFHGLGVDTLAASVRGRGASIQESHLLAGVEALVTRLNVGATAPDWSTVSCLLYEPVQGANGYVPLPVEWLKDIEASAQRAGVVSIADEIQCGYYRHGAFSMAHESGLSPDVLLFSKSMTNGLYPLSAVVYPDRFHQVLPDDEVYWAHTFQTSAIGCEVALSVARYLDSIDINGLIRPVHEILARAALALAGVEGLHDIYITGPTLSFGIRGRNATELVMACEHRNALAFPGGGGKRVRIAPPLTIPPDQLTEAMDCVIDAARATFDNSYLSVRTMTGGTE